MGSPTLQTPQDPILLKFWPCFRSGVSLSRPPPRSGGGHRGREATEAGAVETEPERQRRQGRWRQRQRGNGDRGGGDRAREATEAGAVETGPERQRRQGRWRQRQRGNGGRGGGDRAREATEAGAEGRPVEPLRDDGASLRLSTDARVCVCPPWRRLVLRRCLTRPS
jgi:hypothetical protein